MDCKHRKLFDTQHLEWVHYRVELLVEKLTGGLPSHVDLIDTWMAARNASPSTPPKVAELTSEPVNRAEAHAARVAELEEEAEDVVKTHTVVFARAVEGRPAYEGRAFMGALKEAANVLKTDKKAAEPKMGIPVPNFRSKVVERVYVCERYSVFPLGTQVHIEERPISVMTARGPRTSLKRCEVVYDVPVEFTLHVLDDGVVKPTYLEAMIQYMALNGFGADRSQGSGRAEVVDFVRL